MTRTWSHVVAVVALVYGALAAVTICTVTHSPTADVMVLVGSTVPPTVSLLLVGRELSARVEEVHQQVNGRMTQLIDAATSSHTVGAAGTTEQEGAGHGGG